VRKPLHSDSMSPDMESTTGTTVIALEGALDDGRVRDAWDGTSLDWTER